MNEAPTTTIADILATPRPSVIYDGDLPGVYRQKAFLESSGAPLRHLLQVDRLVTATGPWYEALERTRLLCDQGWIIALLGGRGTGKTQIASCVIADYSLRFRRVRYRKAADLFREVRDSMGEGQSEMGAIRPLLSCQLLVIDELHERSGTDFELRVLTNLIDQRYDRILPTLLVSNLTKSAFAQAMGSSIVSRMHECGEVVECTWPSFREADVT